jgi:DUF3016 family protein
MTFLRTSRHTALALVAGIALAAGVTAAAHAGAPSRIHVTWSNPVDFTDTRQSAGSGIGRQSPDEWLGELAKYLQRRADRVLAPGQQLDVTFTDVKRAGTYEPWRGPQWNDVRIIKDIYPPSIDLEFTLRDTSGNVISEGTRQLRDPAFLSRGIPNQTDPLRFEKRMLDDWLRRDFAPASVSRS